MIELEKSCLRDHFSSTHELAQSVMCQRNTIIECVACASLQFMSVYMCLCINEFEAKQKKIKVHACVCVTSLPKLGGKCVCGGGVEGSFEK